MVIILHYNDDDDDGDSDGMGTTVTTVTTMAAKIIAAQLPPTLVHYIFFTLFKVCVREYNGMKVISLKIFKII